MTDSLPGLEPAQPAPRERGGPIYQGVCKQIRRLVNPAQGEPLIDADLWAGTIAQARSLAASIDRVDGREGAKAQANGVPLAMMHERLDALMARLNPEVADDDPMLQLARRFQEEEARTRGDAQASHPEV